MSKKIYVKQTSYQDCAAASLLMIIRYHKGNIQYDKLSYMLNTSNDGTSAFDIVRVSREIGLDASGIETNIKELEKLKTPYIAYVTVDNIYKHYVVVYKIDKNMITIYDPATGIIKMNTKEFEKIWNNIVIIFTPYKNLPYEQEITVFDYIKTIIKNNFKQVTKILIISFIIFILSIIVSLLYQKLIDKVFDSSFYYLFLITSFFIINFILIYVRNNLILKFQKQLDENIINNCIKNIIYLPYSFFRSKTTGEIISRIKNL